MISPLTTRAIIPVRPSKSNQYWILIPVWSIPIRHLPVSGPPLHAGYATPVRAANPRPPANPSSSHFKSIGTATPISCHPPARMGSPATRSLPPRISNRVFGGQSHSKPSPSSASRASISPGTGNRARAASSAADSLSVASPASTFHRTSTTPPVATAAATAAFSASAPASSPARTRPNTVHGVTPFVR